MHLRIDPKHRRRYWAITLLAVALFIDLADLMPFNIPASALETLFLMYIGVPPGPSLLRGVIDIIPIVDLIPWCTLAVLHIYFGVSLGGLAWLFGEPGGQVTKSPRAEVKAPP